jgi:hypothetical protein
MVWHDTLDNIPTDDFANYYLSVLKYNEFNPMEIYAGILQCEKMSCFRELPPAGKRCLKKPKKSPSFCCGLIVLMDQRRVLPSKKISDVFSGRRAVRPPHMPRQRFQIPGTVPL